jgi:Fe-S-cluster containining protein
LPVPVSLECQRCAACCRWPGEVRLNNDEIAQLAAFLRLSEREFIDQHTRLRRDRRGLALQERPDGSCIFLEGKDCTVQPVKPQQCKDFPTPWVNALWGKAGLEVIERDYPMLFHCAAFQKFLRENRP